MACRGSSVIGVYLGFSVCSMILLYGIAVGIGHVSPFVPHLGYLGDRPFESTVFTQLMVLKATVFAAVLQIQYVRAAAFLQAKREKIERVHANTASFCIGYVIVMSLFVFACFQETNAYWVHHLSFFLYLFGNVVYFCLQTYILKEQKKPKMMVRLILSILMAVFFVTFVIGYVAGVVKFQKSWEERYFWGMNDGGWFFHIISAVSEWILFVLFYSYILIFFFDFKHVRITKTRIVVLPEDNEQH